MTAFALELLNLTTQLDRETWPDLKFRIAIHSGPVVAGVIGKTKYAYDAWGETVNITSRLVELCNPDEVIVTEEVKMMLDEQFCSGSARRLTVRDVGEMVVYPILSKQVRFSD